VTFSLPARWHVHGAGRSHERGMGPAEATSAEVRQAGWSLGGTPQDRQRDPVPAAHRCAVAGPAHAFRQVEDRVRAAQTLVGGRHLGPSPCGHPGDADAESRIDWSMVSVDSTSCRAHQHAAGARKRRPRVPGKRATPRQHRPDEGLGRSRGGLTSKIHLAGEGGRRPLAFLITPGQWPRDTTRGPTSSTAPSPSPQSGSGSAHDPPNPGPSGKLLIATPSAMPRLSEVRSTVPSWQPEST
jgi:hypothetical protein